METPVTTDELERELRATLSARREVGPAYDDHLIEAFMQKLNQRALVPPAPPPQPQHGPSDGQRLGLAIVSLCLLIPMTLLAFALYSIVREGSGTFFVFMALVCLLIVAINYLFNRRH